MTSQQYLFYFSISPNISYDFRRLGTTTTGNACFRCENQNIINNARSQIRLCVSLDNKLYIKLDYLAEVTCLIFNTHLIAFQRFK